MTNEELKSIWAEQTKGPRPVTITPEVIWRLSKESVQFERTIFWRNTREWLATLLVAGTFLGAGLSDENIHWLVIAAAIVACVPMTYAALRRRKRPALEAAQSLTDHLRESIASVQHQIMLLRSVLWWYLMPIAVSVIMIFLDGVQSIQWSSGRSGRAFAALSLAFAFTAFWFFGTWWLNQRAVRKQLEPRLRALQETLSELET